MPNYFIQLIPNLVTLKTKVKSINCFSFWDNNQNKDFFQYDRNSLLNLEYKVDNKIISPPARTKYQFSNYAYDEDKWFFRSRYQCFEFSFFIDEKQKILVSNFLYNRLFIKVSWIDPIGYILSDYITYLLGKEGLSYHAGAAAMLNGKTFLFFGFGKNYKTTIVSMVLQNGGLYIGEEFILLNKKVVYSTIPNSHRFDVRESHKELLKADLREKKVNYSEYDVVVFLVYSKVDKVIELDYNQANIYANEFDQYINTRDFYSYLKAKDFLEGVTLRKRSERLSNKKAKFFLVYFTNVNKAFEFINEY